MASSLSAALSLRPSLPPLSHSSCSKPFLSPLFRPPPSLPLSLSVRHCRNRIFCTSPDQEAEEPEPYDNAAEPEPEPGPAPFFEGPLFDDVEETVEEIGEAYESLYGPAFSGESYLGGDVFEMDSELNKIIDEFDNLIIDKPDDDFEERVVQVRRVTKVVKGGKNLSFRAVVVVGDKKGHVGVGVGKALEVADAVVKAVINGRRNIVTVPLTKYLTFPHRANGKYGSAEVMLRPAAQGSGVISGGAVRIVLELAGVQNALGKQLGSKNPLNNARATIVATQKMRQFADVARERGIPMEELWK